MRRGVRRRLAAFLLAASTFSAGAAEAPRFPVMGTTASFRFSGETAAVAAAERAARREFELIAECCNLHDPKSELSRINASAAAAPFVCSETLYAVLSTDRKAEYSVGTAIRSDGTVVKYPTRPEAAHATARRS